MTVCVIHQSNLFPRLSTLAKLYSADVWIVLDNVQFCRRDYRHRCRLGRPEEPSGQQWLSLSVHPPNGRATRITEARIVEPAQCQRRVLGMLRQHYGRSRHWRALESVVIGVSNMPVTTNRLPEVTESSTRGLLDLLGWQGAVVRSSDLAVSTGRSERLADLTKAVGAETYLCGTGGAKYLDKYYFTQHGPHVIYYRPPTLDTDEIWAEASRLSAVSAIAQVGPERVQSALERSILNSLPGNH